MKHIVLISFPVIECENLWIYRKSKSLPSAPLLVGCCRRIFVFVSIFIVVKNVGSCGKAEFRLKINLCFPAKMQPENGGLLEIMDLARTLRQEQLFIQSEQSAFRSLNDQLTRNSSLVCQLAWICAQQRQNLSDLITSRPETGPTVCCQRSNRLENTKFVDAFKAKTLKYEVSFRVPLFIVLIF